MINLFKNENFFLSNFYECSVVFNGISYKNSEAAYQAQKTVNEDERRQFSELSPEDAKKKGRKIELRPDWEDKKNEIMYEVCKAKFEQNPILKEKLLATGHEELIEENKHGEKYWGISDGEGENFLGRILMRIRNEFNGFDAAKVTDKIISWIREYFKVGASDNTKAVVGISGGKDSSVCAALLVKALGKNRVYGVLMPQGEQADIDCSQKLVGFLEIENTVINIADAYNGLMNEIAAKLDVTTQAKINTPARLRMTTLYAVAACVGGRVVNTCNLSEDWVGYATKFGDGAGDFSLLSDLTVTEVVGIGDYLGLPYSLTHKTPIDGLCGKTDEENLGFTYARLDDYIRGFDDLSGDPELKKKIDRMYAASRHKLELMPKFKL